MIARVRARPPGPARWDFSRGKCLGRWQMQAEGEQAEGETQLLNPPMVGETAGSCVVLACWRLLHVMLRHASSRKCSGLLRPQWRIRIPSAVHACACVQVHALAVPSGSGRPWCQVAAAARGDGTVELFDVDAAEAAGSSSSGGGGAGRGKGGHKGQGGKGAGKGGGGAGPQADAGGEQGAPPCSGGRGAGAGGAGPRRWRGPLMLDRAQGGHTRPASTLCLLGLGPPAGSSSSGGGDDGAGACPSHVLSGSEDRRLLLWRLPRLAQVQGGGGGTEWAWPDAEEGGSQGEGADGGGGGGGVQGPLVCAQPHGRKINCVHAAVGAGGGGGEGGGARALAFVADTSRRLACYRVELGT